MIYILAKTLRKLKFFAILTYLFGCGRVKSKMLTLFCFKMLSLVLSRVVLAEQQVMTGRR